MSTKSKPLRNSGQAPHRDDDRSVDVLLRVASGPDFAFRSDREEALRLHAEFEPLVQMAIKNPEKLWEQESSRRLRELNQENGLTTWLARGGQTLVRCSSFRDHHAQLSYALLLVADEQGPYRQALCRCHLPSCNQFYLAKRNPKGGPANRQYCCPEHRVEYRDSYDRKKRPK